jgi:hypothetical protein
MNFDNKLAGNIKSGLVAVKYSRLPTKLLNAEGSSSFSPSFFEIFSFYANGVATSLHDSSLNFLSISTTYSFVKQKYLRYIDVFPFQEISS